MRTAGRQDDRWTPLLDWYDANKRDLPWRVSNDPYAIWVSEVMLQQTQAATVAPYFLRWMKRFPNVQSLASASLQDLLHCWQGLGYYRRCRNLQMGAMWMMENGIPTKRDGWLLVPGIGPYTAAAIASIAFGERAGVVDGNVERVFARLTGCRASGGELLSLAREWADKNVSANRPGDWNQAMMELGATICTATLAKCEICPLESRCAARQSWMVDELPVRSPAKIAERLVHLVWVPYIDGRFGLRQIPVGDWAGAMWEFPKSKIDDSSGHESGECDVLRKIAGPGWLESLGSFSHSITHYKIEVQCWLLRAETKSNSLRWASYEEVMALPLPSATAKLFRLALKHLGLAPTNRTF